MNFGLESIQFQSGIFFKELAMLFKDLRTEKTSDMANSEKIVVIEKCVEHHTGLKIRFELGLDGPMVDIPRVDKNHPFLQEWIKNFVDNGDVLRMLNNADNIVKGSVNLITGRVTGVFTEITSKVSFPLEMLGNSKFTDEELSAVMLHEIGHLETYYEYLGRIVTTNQVLAGVARSLSNGDDIEKRTVVLISAKKALKLKESGIEELAKSTKTEVVSCVILSNLVEKSRSELGSNIYDINSWEYLADEFAARHHAGKHLITAFDKIYRDSSNKAFRNTGMFVGMEALKFLFLLGGIFTGVGPLAVLGATLMLMDADHVGYNEPEARIQRVRNQIVENLKNPKLSKADVEKLNDDLEVIGQVLKNVNDRRQLIGALYDFLSPAGRRNRNEMLFQQQLEEIANNELFAKAAAFKTL